MLSFARRRADLLFALNRDDVTALAQSGTPPREYHDQRLSIASRRLSFSFASEDNSVSCPSPGDGAEARGQPAGSGPASLQDLLRVIQGWTSSNQITPGALSRMEIGFIFGTHMIICLCSSMFYSLFIMQFFNNGTDFLC